MRWNHERLVAVVRLACALAATAAAGFGVALDADALVTVFLTVIACASCIWSWWKNNNVTQAAQDAQAYLEAIRLGAVHGPAEGPVEGCASQAKEG